MRRGGARGLGLLDLVVVLALLALLIYVVQLDWPREARRGKVAPTTTEPAPPAGHGVTRSSWTSV